MLSRGTPIGWRMAGDGTDPPGHVGLVGEAGFGGDGAEFVAGAGDAEPGVAGAEFGAEDVGSDAVRLGKTARDGFGGETVRFGPGGQFYRDVFAQLGREEVGPVVFTIWGGKFANAERFAEQERCVSDVFFGGAGDGVGIVNAIEAGRAVGIVPVEADDADAVGDHLVGVAVERGVDDDVARPGVNSAGVAGFEELAGERNRGVRADVAVAREDEFVGHELDAGFGLTEIRGGGQGCS